jgi:cation transport regulator
MPYEKLTDLPDSVRNNLPKHAQEIYRAAYNSTEEQYDAEDRRHRVAWSAVKEK